MSGAPSSSVPIPHPDFSTEYAFCMALRPTCPGPPHWAGRSIFRGQELPESWNLSQFNPRRLLAHSSAVATCDVAPVCPCRDSCQRGWRLLYIVTAYHSCSEVLHPHLTRFLHDVSRTPGLPFQGERSMSGDPGLHASRMGTGWAAGGRGNPEGLTFTGAERYLLILIYSPNICEGSTGAGVVVCLI